MKNIIQWNSEFIYDEKGQPCMMCGKIAHYVDIFAEGHLCSKECTDKFYDMIEEYERTHPMDYSDF